MSLPASSSFWWLPAVLGLWPQTPVSASISLCVSVSSPFLSLIGTLVIRMIAPNPE